MSTGEHQCAVCVYDSLENFSYSECEGSTKLYLWQRVQVIEDGRWEWVTYSPSTRWIEFYSNNNIYTYGYDELPPITQEGKADTTKFKYKLYTNESRRGEWVGHYFHRGNYKELWYTTGWSLAYGTRYNATGPFWKTEWIDDVLSSEIEKITSNKIDEYTDGKKKDGYLYTYLGEE